ncbi:MAG0480 family ComEC-like protein [Metamycoplasma hominis]|uniref:MAG0480 family ComEC-like protein n=1 Tax=Metamycoplasma hominis TaxID=2098 RepID=UPI001939DECC
MTGIWKFTRSRWKNFNYIKKSFNNLNTNLFVALSFCLYCLIIYKINIVISSIMLSLIIAVNFFNLKYWIKIAIVFPLIFLVHYLWYLDLFKINGKNICGKFEIKRFFNKSILIKYQYYNVLVKNWSSWEFNNFYKYNIELSGTLSIIKNQNMFSLSNKIDFELLNVKLVSKAYAYQEKIPILQDYDYKTKKFLALVLFNIQQANDLFVDQLKQLSVMHYFTISGFHFGIIYLLISKILKWLNSKELIVDLISILMLFFYLKLLNFSISASRAFLFLILKIASKNIFKGKFNNIDILSFAALLLIFFDIRTMYSYSFILSFTITLIIFLILDIKKIYKNNIFVNFLFIILPYISSISIVISFNPKFNILGIFYQLFFLPISIFNYVFCLFAFIVKPIIKMYVSIFEIVINTLSYGCLIIEVEKNSILGYSINFYIISIYTYIKIKREYYLLTNHFK